MVSKKEIREVIIDWSKFKSKAKGKMLEKAKEGYIEFCKMLNEVDFELVSDYNGSQEKVELVYKLDNNIKINKRPNNFKLETYKRLIDFKKQLINNKDKFINFNNLTSKENFVAQINTFDNGKVFIDIANYNSWNKGRQDFYDKLKEVGGCVNGYYNDNKTKMNIFIDDVKLNAMNPNNFKNQTYKRIIDFKKQLIESGDKFIKFVGLTDCGNLVAKIKTIDNNVINIDIAQYNKWSNARQDFYDKLKEVNGHTTDYYINKETKMNIYVNDIKLNPMTVNNFKRSTYESTTNFKRELKNNSDTFIKFVGLTSKGKLIAKIKTFDKGIVNINISRYNSFNKSRQGTYNYCNSKNYKILSSYVGNQEKILIKFDCGHKPHWITPSDLKYGYSCPICSESKGEKVIRQYLEKNNIDFKQEHRFIDCRYKLPLPFDFYIPDYNLCIEFDGIQHFEAFNHFGGKEKLKTTKKRDKIKNNYCKENEINLLRIPYWELGNIDKILNEKFKKLKKLKEVC